MWLMTCDSDNRLTDRPFGKRARGEKLAGGVTSWCRGSIVFSNPGIMRVRIQNGKVFRRPDDDDAANVAPLPQRCTA